VFSFATTSNLTKGSNQKNCEKFEVSPTNI